mgnify:CR=1 FL=1
MKLKNNANTNVVTGIFIGLYFLFANIKSNIVPEKLFCRL